MARILVAGLNPAWQKILEFGSFRAGEVNRADSLIQLASGKGLNAAKVLRRLGHDVSLLQILGGSNGQRCLVACQALGIRSLHAWVDEETRQCLTLVDRGAGTATEVIEPFAVETAEPAALQEALLGVLPAEPDAFDALLLCGTLPIGAPQGMYAALLDRYAPKVLLLDAWQGVDGAIGRLAARGAAPAVAVVKVNRTEYEALGRAGGPSLRNAGDLLFLVTDGPRDARVMRAGRTLARLPLSPLASVRNPIGAGDTVSAATAHFLLEGLEAPEAFRRALAMGTASCLSLEPAEWVRADYEAILAGQPPAVPGE